MLARCANCGAEFTPETDDIFVECKYCKASIFIFSGGSGLRYYINPTIEADKAELIIKNQFLKKGYTGEIKIISKEALLYPFYKRENQTSLTPAREDSNYHLLTQLHFKGGEIKFFNENKIKGYLPIDPDLEPNTAKEDKINLIYYPLIFVTYRYLDNDYKLVIDGFSEEIITEVLPIVKDILREKAYIYIFIITAFLLFIEFIAFESIFIGFILNILTIVIIWAIFPTIFKMIEDIYVSQDKDNKMS